MLISFAVTAKLICVFVFTYVDCWFSHEVAQIHLKSILHFDFSSFLARLHEVHRAIVVTSVVYVYVYVRITLSVKVFKIVIS